MFGTGLLQCREPLPVKIIVGACVGNGMFLIIVLCLNVVVLYRIKTLRQNHQQQDMQCQPQPCQQQQAHQNVRNANEEGYINDQMAPKYEIPFTSLADDGEYLQATLATGIPMDQMAGTDDYVNVNTASKNEIPFSHLAGNGEYLHMAPVDVISKDQTAGNGDYANANMASKERNVENA